MSLTRLRRSSRLLALILLIASAWQLPHRTQDDEICAPSPQAHDESKHVFTNAVASGHPEHCAICHWTRWLRPGLSTRSAVSPLAESGAELTEVTSPLRRDPSRDRLPPRAPPSAVLAIARPVQLS